MTLILSGCGQQAQKEIKRGATSGPHAEVAEAVAKEAANQGLKVTVVEFSDYVTPDQALADGDIDLNSYQHEPFLKNFSAPENNFKVTIQDIQSNPKQLQFVELEAAQLPRSLQDVDIAVITMNYVMSVTDPGDKVIVFSPFYENYGADAILCSAEPIYVSLKPPAYTFDITELEKAFQQHPKALILCNPSNPCGKVFTREELQIIADLAEKYDTWVITDEVYPPSALIATKNSARPWPKKAAVHFDCRLFALPFHINHCLKHFITDRDNLGIRLETTLGNNHIRELVSDIHVGHLQG